MRKYIHNFQQETWWLTHNVVIDKIRQTVALQLEERSRRRNGREVRCGYRCRCGGRGEPVISYADQALYTAKEEGRNRAVFYDDTERGLDSCKKH